MVLCMGLHMVLSMMVFFSWCFVDPIKGTMVMFSSRVNGLGFMNALACIYMCCNTKRNIMKIKLVDLVLGSRGKKSLCIYFMFYALAIVYFCH